MPAWPPEPRALDGNRLIRLVRFPHNRTPEQMAALHRVFRDAPDYCARVIGHIPALEEMRASALPPGKTPDDDYFFAVYVDDEMIGCLDLLRGYPDRGTVYLGLLLLSERHQRRGLGRRVYAEAEKIALSWPEICAIRGAVVRTNEVALPFWKSMGFGNTGIRRPYRVGEVMSESYVIEKKLGRA